MFEGRALTLCQRAWVWVCLCVCVGVRVSGAFTYFVPTYEYVCLFVCLCVCLKGRAGWMCGHVDVYM